MVLRRYQLSEFAPSGGGLWMANINVSQDVLDFTFPNGNSNGQAGSGVDIGITIPSTANRDRGWGRPRGLMLQWVDTVPSGFKPDGKIYIPVLIYNRYRSCSIGQTGTFRGLSVRIAAKIPEVLRA